MLLAMAQKDTKALKGMLDADTFAEEIFGFHAQQAVEKALKAWIASMGMEYPLTHDISKLLEVLNAAGQDAEKHLHFADISAFGVWFRYAVLDEEDELLDRKALIQLVDALIMDVTEILDRNAR